MDQRMKDSLDRYITGNYGKDQFRRQGPYRELILQLLEDGYGPHFNADDAAAAREYPCELCGGQCRYRGLKKDNSYRAVSICTQCGDETEF